MDDEIAFLRLIRENPTDLTPRLVYADWLEEHGDIRAEYLRLQVHVASVAHDSRECQEIRGKLREIRLTLDSDWLRRISITAIFHGIHANAPALDAVVKDATRLCVDRFVCLGDMVAAGPNPVECCRWVRENCDWCFTGYWDRCLRDPSLLAGSSAGYRNETVLWNRENVLKEPDGSDLIEFFSSQTHSQREGSVFYIHGSVRHPNYGILPNSMFADRRRYFDPSVAREYQALPAGVRVCFNGNIGYQCIVWPNGQVIHSHEYLEFIDTHEMAHPLISNVGSVGLPHDYDPRAGYVILAGDWFMFRRVAYNLDRLVSDFERASELSEDCRAWMIKRHLEGV